MRIAIPLAGGRFNAHFGQSRSFWLCDVQPDARVVAEGWELQVPGNGGCQAIPMLLASSGVQLVIAGGMGEGARQRLSQYGIDVLLGVGDGEPRQIVQQYLAGQLPSTGQTCSEHAHHNHGAAGGQCHGHGER